LGRDRDFDEGICRDEELKKHHDKPNSKKKNEITEPIHNFPFLFARNKNQKKCTFAFLYLPHIISHLISFVKYLLIFHKKNKIKKWHTSKENVIFSPIALSPIQLSGR
jgi:hypothetical protein